METLQYDLNGLTDYRYGIRLEYLYLSSTIIGILILIFVSCKNIFKRDTRNDSGRVDGLLDNYQPEPLVPQRNGSNMVNDPDVITSMIGTKIQINNKKLLHFACNNNLNLITKDLVEYEAEGAINKYGVGSCGPRGFYGTLDVHLFLEERIASFMGMEEAVVYSFGFSTIASAIPAYCKREDVVFCDELISFAAEKGLDAARCKHIIYFKHNDPEDLERKIIEFNNSVKNSKIERKKFLIVEGIYAATGHICNIIPLVELRRKYKMRLIIDESYSIGALGKTGRGITEHFNIDKADVDMVIGSLEGLIGSIGGFCVGSHFIIEHQRLSGLGYCFSASLPPVFARVAIHAFNYIDENNHISENLRSVCKFVHSSLQSVSFVNLSGDKYSPLKFLTLNVKNKDCNDRRIYKHFVAMCKENNLAVGLIQDKRNQFKIQLNVNIDFTDKQISEAVQIIAKVAMKINEF